MSAQLEDGYTRIANALLEQLAQSTLNGTQFNIILAVLRNTYGYQRKSHGISLTFLATATKRKKEQVKREMDRLIEMKVLFATGGSFTESREIGINKNFEEWQLGDCTLKRAHHPKQSTPEKGHTQYPNQGTGGVPELGHQERKVFKENLKENVITITDDVDPFIQILESYCSLHKKGEWHIKPKEREAMHELLQKGISSKFVIDAMTKIRQDKVDNDGQQPQGFTYYPAQIKQAWETIHSSAQEVSAGADASNVTQIHNRRNGFSRKPQIPIIQDQPLVEGPSPEKVAAALALARKLDGR